MPIKIDPRDFLLAVKAKHGETTFDYSKVAYVRAWDPITVICKTHGEFYPRAKDFHNGSGCRKCADLSRNNVNKIAFDEFLRRAKAIHGDKYQYVQSSYKDFSKKAEIICAKHGSFLQAPSKHIRCSEACPKCLGRNLSQDDFLEKAKEAHGDHFVYDKTFYKEATQKIIVGCPVHGDFSILPGSHISGEGGCRRCADQRNSISKDQFLERARELYKNKYDYTKGNYLGFKEKCEVICPKHGGFLVTPVAHLCMETGCPKCPITFSKPHEILVKYLDDLGYKEGIDFVVNDRASIKPLELDIHFKGKKFAIEVNGTYWHSTNKVQAISTFKFKHLNKLKACREAGIKLIQITDKEILSQFSLVTSLISSYLGEIKQKHFARKLSLKEVSSQQARTFLTDNHFQGDVKASVRLGLYSGEGELLQLMTFGKSRFSKKHSYELFRLCTKQHHTIVGGASKLFKHFLDNCMKEGESIVSYCDLRLFIGDIYKNLNFSQKGESKPSYSYLDNSLNFVGSRLKFQKHKLAGLLPTFDPKKTEMQNMFDNGYRALWDCGNGVWEYTKK